MARVYSPRNHDWLGVNVSFDDGCKANVTWSRNGEKVSVTPPNAVLAETFSNIVMQSKSRMGKEGYPHANLGVIADVMVRAGTASRTLEAYLDVLKADLHVTGDRPAPRQAAAAPDATVASVRKSRGWNVLIAFSNGEKLDIKINGKSLSYRAEPQILSRDDEIMRFLFAAKDMGTMNDEELANTAKTTAEASNNIDDWLTAMRAAFTPAGPRR